MKKLVIYPFSYNFREIVSYSGLLDEFELIAAITASEADNEWGKVIKNTKIKVTNEYDTAVQSCDSILFLEGYEDKIKNQYIQKAEDALEAGKEVLVTKKIFDMLPVESRERVRCLTEGKRFIINVNETSYLKQIQVPVVGVIGTGPYCNKFSCELELGKFFREQGYRVLQLGSKEIAALYGFRKLPDFLYDTGITAKDRTLMFNQYMFLLCKKEKPDIVIMGIPDAIMPVNHKIHNDFAEIPTIITNSVTIDIAVLGLYHIDNIEPAFIEQYKNYCRYKLNCPVEYILLSNTSVQIDPNSNDSVLQYYHQDCITESIEIQLNNNEKVMLFGMEDQPGKSMVMKGIYNDLVSNVDAF